jgi:tetratricopeptide (TPR) repeat protein/DNA-binding XRE family transcriptional regulator
VATQPSISFAFLLRQLRNHAGLTQEELAEKASLSPRSVSDLERGINLTARRDTVQLLADALNLAGPARTMFEATARGQSAATETSAAGSGQPSVTVSGAFLAKGPAASLAAVHALPRDTVNFTGRAPELDLLVRELKNSLSGAEADSVAGVHAIDGMAGIGKTTFAVHVAHMLAPLFPDGQFFLPLHSHTPGQEPADPGSALGTLLLATGIATNQIPDSVDARMMLWRNGIAGKRILLVLDDAAGHEQVLPLLPGSAGSLVLITSRRRLSALEEATPISLDTLPQADASDLFSRLAGRPGLNEDAVTEITRLCGYLPLAIRLTACTIRRHPSWDLADFAAELAAAKDRLDAMRAENLSVTAAFDLSYQDLASDQQRLFRRLGLNPGTSIDAFAAAALDDATVTDTRRRLDYLYDHHLITEPAHGRYRMHDLIGEHARTLAAREDTATQEAAVLRLLDYHLYTATGATRLIARRMSSDMPVISTQPGAVPDFSDRDHAIAWLEVERENLRRCADYAAEHSLSVYAIWIPARLSEFLRTRGYWDEALWLHQRAAIVASSTGDRIGQATSLANLGDAQYDIGDYAAAAATFAEALELHRAAGNRLGQADVLNSVGLMQAITDGYTAAADSLTQALSICQELDDRLGQAMALSYLGLVKYATADYELAEPLLQEALDLYTELGDQRGQAWVLTDFGILYRWSGNYPAARTALTKSLELFRNLSDQRNQAVALDYLGMVEHLAGDHQTSLMMLNEALRLYQALNLRHGMAGALNNIGAVQHSLGDYDAAAVSLRQALSRNIESEDRQGQAEALNNLGALLLDSRGPNEALPRYTEALNVARDIGAPREESDALEGIGRCLVRSGDLPGGRARLRQALEVRQRIKSPTTARLAEFLASVE